jgi:preprotein translocase subunit SecF
MALSALVIGAGFFMILTRGIPLGVEFSGGTNLIIRFTAPVSEDQIRTALQSIPFEVQLYGEPESNQMLIRLPQTQQVEVAANLSADVPKVEQLLKAANLPAFKIEGTEIVGPTVGAELRRQAIYATLLSMLGITAWIAFRFRVSFALGSIIATFHDVFVTLAFLAFFRYEMSLNVIAAMLTMVGYSMNDMIVIFDRVRENTRLQKREPLETAINTSLNQTLTRTIITSGTVFISVMALFLFGGEVLEAFAFTMLAGTIATTYSGWFIAPSLAIMLSRKPSAAPARLRTVRPARGRKRRAPAARSSSPPANRSRSARPARPNGSTVLRDALSCGAARTRPGDYRVSAGFVDRAPAARRRRDGHEDPGGVHVMIQLIHSRWCGSTARRSSRCCRRCRPAPRPGTSRWPLSSRRSPSYCGRALPITFNPSAQEPVILPGRSSPAAS